MVNELPIANPTVQGVVEFLQDLMQHGVAPQTVVTMFEPEFGVVLPLALAVYTTDSGDGTLELTAEEIQ